MLWGRVVKWGLDAAHAPDADTAFRQLADGWTFYCGYLGGDANHVWTADDWRRLDGLGFKLLPIWVAPPWADDPGREAGVDEGNAALGAMQALGLSGVLVLDIENGLAPREYARGFVDAVGAGNCAVVLYGSPTTIGAIGDLPWSAWWLAWWPERGMSVLPARPDWSMWQFSMGPSADYDVCVDDFPFCALAEPEAPSAPPSAEA